MTDFLSPTTSTRKPSRRRLDVHITPELDRIIGDLLADARKNGETGRQSLNALIESLLWSAPDVRKAQDKLHIIKPEPGLRGHTPATFP